MNLSLKQQTPLALCLLGALTLGLMAQTPTPKPVAGGAPAAVPNTKIAVVSIAAFREGIGELKQKYEKLSGEFNAKSSELNSLQTSIEAKQKTLNDGKLNEQQARKLSDDVAQLQKELQRKQEDYQVLARKREEEETTATYNKINDFMSKYVQQRGITLIFEASTTAQMGLVLYLDAKADITEDFIKEYNKANPAATAQAAPGAKQP